MERARGYSRHVRAWLLFTDLPAFTSRCPSPRANVSEHVRHDGAGEYGRKDANDDDDQTILAIVQKGVAVLPTEG